MTRAQTARVSVRLHRVPVALLVITLAGGLMSWWMVRRADRAMRDDLLQQTRLVAQAVHTDQVRALTGTDADVDTPNYLRLKAHLAAVRQAKPKCRFIYMMSRGPGGGLVFLVDDCPVGHPDEAPAGMPYGDAPEAFLRVMDTGAAEVAGPFSDRWGAFVSGCVPVEDERTGKTVAILAVDFDAQTWRRDLARAAATPLGLACTLILILVAGRGMLARRARLGGAAPHWMQEIELGLVVAAGLALTAFVSWTAHRGELHSRRTAFAQLGASRTHAVADVLRDLRNTELEGLARFYAGSNDVTPHEFARYTAHLTRNPAVKAWAWASVVPAAGRDAFEAAQRAAGLSGYRIWELDARGRPVPATNRDVHYPFSRVAPLEGNESSLGYDLGSDPSIRAVLEEAERTGLITASAPITPVQATDGASAILVCEPVFDTAHPKQAIGSAIATLRPEGLLESAGASILGTQLAIGLLGTDGRIHSLAATDPAGAAPDATLSTMRPIFAFGKTFALTAYADAGFMRVYPAKAGRLTGLMGLLLTAALSVVIGMVLRRRTVLEQLVAEKTLELRESEQHLAATLRSIGDGVIACDAEGAVASLNAVAERLTGWSTVDASGRPVEQVFQIIDARTRETAGNPVRRTLREGVTVALANHTTLVARDGPEYQIADSCAPIHDENGAVTGAVLVFRDVTEEYRRREQLAEERQRLDYILGVTRTGIDIVDAEFNLRYVDPGWQATYGDPTGRKCYEYFMGADAPCQACGIPRALQTRQPVITEETLPREGNRAIEVHTIPFQDSTGEWLVAEFNVDINERKQAEEALRQSKQRFDELAEQSRTYTWEVDAEGLYTYVSHVVEAVLGYRPEELVGKMHFHDLHPQQGREEFKSAALDMLARGRAFTGVINPVQARDGQTLWVSTNGIPMLSPDGTLRGYRGSDTDITEQKRAEDERESLQAQLLQSQRLESVGRLAGGVAHDFNNILSVIIGHSELALEQLAPTDPLHRSLTEIHTAAERSAAITRQLLAFARKQTAAPRPLDLNETVDGMLSMLRRLIGEDIELAWHPAGDLWAVNMDPAQIDQILANLCVNARDAIADVGRLTIETANVSVDDAYCALHEDAVPGEYVTMAVTDTGCGMDQETLATIFEPFFTTKDTGKGTGLGLATVYGIIKQNNGFIQVYSEPGLGTRFAIYLPRYAGQPLPSRLPPDATEPQLGARETILLVEDEPTIQEMAQVMLERLGYVVLPATAPSEAVRLAEKHAGDIQLLMTDVIMPEMNGRDLAARLQALYPDLKCLFMSGYAADVIVDHGVLAAGVHFIQKPFSMRGLAARIRDVLDNA